MTVCGHLNIFINFKLFRHAIFLKLAKFKFGIQYQFCANKDIPNKVTAIIES